MSAYELGMRASKEGREIWDNPYSQEDTDRQLFIDWLAGYCFERRLRLMGLR